MRKADLTDFDAVFNLFWAFKSKIILGEVSFSKSVKTIIELLKGDENEGIFINQDATAIGAFRIVENEYGEKPIGYGLWLISKRIGEGAKLGRFMVNYVKNKSAIPVCSGRSEMELFYRRLGMSPKEIVFSGE